jgi:hypothetical protein
MIRASYVKELLSFYSSFLPQMDWMHADGKARSMPSTLILACRFAVAFFD